MATPLLDQMKRDLLKDNTHIKLWLNRTDDFNWCAAQVSYAASRAGLLDVELPKSTWAYKHAVFMRDKGRLYKYQDVKTQLRPDCVIFKNNDRADERIDHIAIFENYNSTKTQMLTIGGNEPDWSGTTTSSLRRVRQNYTSLTSESLFYVGYPSYVAAPNATPYTGPLATETNLFVSDDVIAPPEDPLIVLNPGHLATDDRGFLGPETEGSNNRATVAIIKNYLLNKYVCKVEVVEQPTTDFKVLGSKFPQALLFYSHHTNAYSDTTARGTEVFYYYGRTLAQNIAITTAKILQTVVRGDMNGAKRNSDQFGGAGYAVLNQAQGAGVKHGLMGEIGFHTNPSEAELMVSRRTEIGETIAKEIAAYLGLKLKPTIPVSEPQPPIETPPDPEAPPSEPVEETPVVIPPPPPPPPPEDPEEPYDPPIDTGDATVVETTPDPVNGPYEANGEKLWFRVVIGPFWRKRDVLILMQKLRFLGYSESWIQSKTLPDGKWYNVIAGTTPTKASAEAIVANLSEDGINSSQIVSLMLSTTL